MIFTETKINHEPVWRQFLDHDNYDLQQLSPRIAIFEADELDHINLLDGYVEQAQTQGMRSQFPHRIALFLPSFFLALPLLAPAASCAAQDRVPGKNPDSASSAQTTLVIFSDRPIPEGLWPALVAALRKELASGSPQIQVLVDQKLPSQWVDPLSGADSAASSIEIVRGDTVGPSGLIANNPITVYLHGECKITPRPGRPFSGENYVSGSTALGWVQSNHGRIEPFAHVECDPLGQMLAVQAFGLNRDQRNQLMAVAIARVILHEWIHIATQNPRHSTNGISKAQFGVADLLAHPDKSPVARGARLHRANGDGL
jgi:hypothetical protein